MRSTVLLCIIFIIIISTVFYIVLFPMRIIDKEKIIQHVLTFQNPDGGFSFKVNGNSSLTATTFALGTMYTLNAQDKIDKDSVVNFVRQCKGLDGGYKDKPDGNTSLMATNDAIIILYLLGHESEINKSTIINFIGKYDTLYIKLAILHVMDDKKINKSDAINFIMNNYEGSHFKKDSEILRSNEVMSTFHSLIFLHLFNSTDNIDKDKIHNYLRDKLSENLFTTFYSIGSLKIIDEFRPEYRDEVMKFIFEKTKDGMFVDTSPMSSNDEILEPDSINVQFVGSVIYINVDKPVESYMPWGYLFFS